MAVGSSQRSMTSLALGMWLGFQYQACVSFLMLNSTLSVIMLTSHTYTT